MLRNNLASVGRAPLVGPAGLECGSMEGIDLSPTFAAKAVCCLTECG
jgi:hypothetical protein